MAHVTLSRPLTYYRRKKTLENLKDKEGLLMKLFRERTDRTMRSLKRIEIKSKFKIKKGIFNSFPKGIRNQLYRLTDHLNDKNDNRISRTLFEKSEMFKNLHVVYAIMGNGEVVGWCNYWKDREDFKFDFDSWIFIHVKKQFRGNGIGRKIFKKVYRAFLKGKRNKRKYFAPNFNRSKYKKLDHKDFYDKMIDLAKAKKI